MPGPLSSLTEIAFNITSADIPPPTSISTVFRLRVGVSEREYALSVGQPDPATGAPNALTPLTGSAPAKAGGHGPPQRLQR